MNERVLKWIEKKRKECSAEAELIKIDDLSDWKYFEKEGVLRHKKGEKYFFSVKGVMVGKAKGCEVESWNQPIITQEEGGVLAIFCQKKKGRMKYLLHAKYEPGYLNKIQLAPTIQATQSNLKRRHKGIKPKFSEYLNSPKAKIIYKAKHSEEGARFWKKENLNMLLELDKNLKLPKDDDYIWLTLPEIKKLMMIDNLVNPFVKTILAPI